MKRPTSSVDGRIDKLPLFVHPFAQMCAHVVMDNAYVAHMIRQLTDICHLSLGRKMVTKTNLTQIEIHAGIQIDTIILFVQHSRETSKVISYCCDRIESTGTSKSIRRVTVLQPVGDGRMPSDSFFNVMKKTILKVAYIGAS